MDLGHDLFYVENVIYQMTVEYYLTLHENSTATCDAYTCSLFISFKCRPSV